MKATRYKGYITVICLVGGDEVVPIRRISCILLKSEYEVKIGKNELENSKIKVARNDRRKVRTSPICVLEVRRDVADFS